MTSLTPIRPQPRHMPGDWTPMNTQERREAALVGWSDSDLAMVWNGRVAAGLTTMTKVVKWRLDYAIAVEGGNDPLQVY